MSIELVALIASIFNYLRKSFSPNNVLDNLIYVCLIDLIRLHACCHRSLH